MGRCGYALPRLVYHFSGGKLQRLSIVRQKLKRIADAKAVALRKLRHAVCVTALDHGADLRTRKVRSVRVVLPRIAVVKAGGIGTMANHIDLTAPHLGKLLPRDCTVYRMAVGIRDGGGVVRRFHAALYLHARNTRTDKLRNMLDHAHIP